MTDTPKIKKTLPRHSAGSMELKEGTGPITAMCSCGTFLEIYKQDTTFRVQTPESIDPDGTNPNAPWVASAVADVGSNNLIVARVLLQSRRMLDAAMIEGELDKDAVVIHLHGIKETLVSCEKISRRVGAGIDRIINEITNAGIRKDNQGRGLNPFPQVPDLDLDCGAFLIQLNRAIKLVCELPSRFLNLTHSDKNFDYLAGRLADVLGETSPLTVFVRENAATVRYLIELRNYHEHPKDIRTVVENFKVLPSGQIQGPVWYLEGRGDPDPHSIKDETVASVAFVRDLAEIMFIHLLMARLSTKFPFYIEQIPADQIADTLPIRYNLSIDLSRIPFASANADDDKRA